MLHGITWLVDYNIYLVRMLDGEIRWETNVFCVLVGKGTRFKRMLSDVASPSPFVPKPLAYTGNFLVPSWLLFTKTPSLSFSLHVFLISNRTRIDTRSTWAVRLLLLTCWLIMMALQSNMCRRRLISPEEDGFTRFERREKKSGSK